MADQNQIGGGVYDVASTVQQILDRRREQARQAMIDRLTEEQKRNEMDVNQQNAKTNAKEAETQQFNAAMNALKDAPPNPGQALPDSFYKDVLTKTGHYGTIAPPVPSVTTSTAVQPPQNASPAELENWAKQMEANPPAPDAASVQTPTVAPTKGYLAPQSLLDQLAARKKVDALDSKSLAGMDPLDAARLFTEAGLMQNVPGEALPQRPFNEVVIGPDGRVTRKIPMQGGDKSVQTTWSPAAYQPTFSQTGIVDTQGNLIVMGNRLGKDGKPQVFKIPVGTVSKVPSGTSAASAKDIISPKALSDLTNASAGGKNGQGDPAKRLQARSEVMQDIVNSAKAGRVSPKIASLLFTFNQMLNTALSSGSKPPTLQDFSAQVAAAGLTPDEANLANQLAGVFVNDAAGAKQSGGIFGGLMIGSK